METFRDMLEVKIIGARAQNKKNKFKIGDKVKFISSSDYVEPKDRKKVFTVKGMRGDELKLDDGYYYPEDELYKI